jgi:L-aminopeptidase/D-esterase-like protein
VVNNSLTNIPGIQVGHWTNLEAATGCTVILCPAGAVAGVDVRGGAPGTRELALLDPVCTVERIHALVLAGGSAFGLAAADGVMRWLEECGIGYDVGVARIPIVPAAILFDLPIGSAVVRPDAEAGYAACLAATAKPVAEGNVGAGTGATVGKFLGFQHASKGGLGSACRILPAGSLVAALAVVNAAGNVIDPQSQRTLAGVRQADGRGFVDVLQEAPERIGQPIRDLKTLNNTTLAVVATNVALSKAAITKVAQMAHDGLARTIAPVHTAIDGDIVFALSLGEQYGDASTVGAVAAEVVAGAIVRAVQAATTLHNIPSGRECR